MQDIEIFRNVDELRTDSRSLAPLLDHRHRSIIQNIDRYAPQLKRLATLVYKTETLVEGEVKKPIRYALLTEDQCYFLLTLMRNNPTVIEAKLKLVEAFRQARSELVKAQVARKDGKTVRRMETDAIKEMVDYATAHGSQNANKYYMVFTKMTYDTLGIQSGQRDSLPAQALTKIKIAEGIIDMTLRDGIAAGLEYKDIFQIAKKRVQHLVPLISPPSQ